MCFARCIYLVLMSFSFFFYCIAGIRQLQLMLLKMALLLGIEIHVNVEFKTLIEPPEEQETESKWASRKAGEKKRNLESVFHQRTIRQGLRAGSFDSFLFDYTCSVFSGIGWRAEVHPRTHPVNELEFDVIIGADGRRNTLPGKLPCTDQRNAFVKWLFFN